MPCKECHIFHDGVLKGECRCKICTCNDEWIFNKNRDINKPRITFGETGQ